jgi:ketosteroid isomerase-like protein
MNLYVPNESLFVFDVGTPRQFVGAMAYRKDWQDTLAVYEGPVNYTITDLAITTDGVLAFSRSVQRLVGTDVHGKPMDMTVRVTRNHKKFGGKWLIVLDHVSFSNGFEDRPARLHVEAIGSLP